jgi:precorrin-4 methylase
MRSIGAFEPEVIAAMSDAFEAACELLRETGQPEVAREVIATRIIAAARSGERDAVRLREAALRKPD